MSYELSLQAVDTACSDNNDYFFKLSDLLSSVQSSLVETFFLATRITAAPSIRVAPTT